MKVRQKISRYRLWARDGAGFPYGRAYGKGRRIVAAVLVVTLALLLGGVLPERLGSQPSTAEAAEMVAEASAVLTGPTTIPAGNVTTSATWTPDGSPYLITGMVKVIPGVTLTVLPGTVVKFTGGAAQLAVYGGQLVARGLPTQPIIFTSGYDDTAGGDSNGDGAATTPHRGDWLNINFTAATRDDALRAPVSVINNAIVRYSGNGSGSACQVYAAINVTNFGRVAVSRTDFVESLTAGMRISSFDDGVGFATVSASRFRDSGCGINATSGDVLGNVFESTIATDAAWLLNPKALKFYGNWLHRPALINPAVTREAADLRNNALLAGVKDQPTGQDPLDLANNWWGQALVAAGGCYNPNTTYIPAVKYTFISGSLCGLNSQSTITAYFTKVLPALAVAPPLPDVGPGGVPEPTIAVPDEQVYGSDASSYAYRPVGTQADPVNTANGAFVTDSIDAVVPAPGMPLGLARSYNSADVTTGPLGPGWSLGYDISLPQDVQGNRILHGDDGQQVKFTHNSDGTYSGAPGATATLTPVGNDFVLLTRDRSRHEFNADGQLTALVDRNDQEIDFTYLPSGRLATATAGARTLTYTWDATQPLVTRVDLPDGRWVGFTYTAGRLVTVRDLRGKNTAYSYDTAGRLTSVTSPTARVVNRLAYDATTGRVTDQWDARNNHSTFAWNSVTGTATMTDARGGVWTDVYIGNVLVQRVDAAGATTSYEYDGDLRILASTNARGVRSVFGYNQAGDLVSFQGPGKPVTTVYDEHHQVTSTINARGTELTYDYDTDGNLTTVTRPNPDGGPPLVNTSVYNTQGLVTSATDARGKTTTFTYNTDGNPTSTLDPAGGLTTYGYDIGGRRTSVVEPRGNVTGADPEQFTTLATLNDADQITSVRDPLGNTDTITYNDDGQVTQSSNAKNRVTTYTYDDDGHPLSTQGPDLTVAPSTATYDANGNVATSTDPAGRTITYTYNQVNRPTQATGPLGTYTYAYDVLGNMTTVTDPSATSTQMLYDLSNRLASINYPGTTPDVTYTYDANGNRSKMTDGSGTVTYTYDVLDQLTAVTRGTSTFGFSYDNVGNTATTTYPDNTQYTYTYDDNSRLSTTTSATTTLASYGYDPAGNRTATTLGDGTTTTGTYDKAGRLTRITDTTNTPALVDETYTLDATGNPTQISHANATTDTYTYDTLDRLTQACFTTTTCTAATNYINWAYDTAGNILTETRPTGTTTFNHNTAGQLTSTVGTAGTTNYTYNALGQQTVAGATTYAYNASGRMTSATTGGATTTYAYDGDGRRLSATAGTAVTKFAWNPRTYDLALEQNGSNTVLRRYAYGAGRINMTVPNTGNFYYHTDALGSVLALTDSTGAPQRTYSWEPYGRARTNVQVSPTAPANPMQWVGEYTDTTGLSHLRARQYDPTTGQFTQTDPSSATAISGTYTYGSANPLVYTDPYGTWSVRDTNSVARTTAAFASAAAIVSGATGVGALVAAVLSAIALLAGAVTAATSAYIAYDTCRTGKGSCAGAVIDASVDTATAAFGVGILGKVIKGARTVGGGAQGGGVGRLWERIKDVSRGDEGSIRPFAGRNSDDQDALIRLAKDGRRGVSERDADTLAEWADELGVPGHGTAVHPSRHRTGDPGFGASVPHINIGPVKHIPVIK